MIGFVGSQILEKAEVTAKIKSLDSFLPYYFLRWPHWVSGILTQDELTQEYLPKFPDDLSPQGQVFTQGWELRWERRVHRINPQRTQYHLLLLSKDKDQSPFSGFEPLQENQRPIPWKTRDYTAVIHQEESSEGTRFPKGFRVPRGFKADSLKQRHFIHETTGITQFVALVSPP